MKLKAFVNPEPKLAPTELDVDKVLKAPPILAKEPLCDSPAPVTLGNPADFLIFNNERSSHRERSDTCIISVN